jgi:plastocyanin
MSLFFDNDSLTRQTDSVDRKDRAMRSVLTAITILATMACGVSRAEEYLDPDLCPGVWYTSESAESPEGKGCLTELQKKTGTIAATIKSPYARLVEGVVHLVEVPGKKFQLPWKNPVQDQKNLIFAPHVQGLLLGSTVDFPNSDSVRHNVFSPPPTGQAFNLGTYPPEEVKHVTFENLGVVPLGCNVHTEMSAYLVVLPHPFFATTDKKTRQAVIRNVPPGQYKVSFFHEKLQPKELDVTVEAGKEAVLEFSDLEKK